MKQELQPGFHAAMPALSKGAEGEIELEAKLKGAAIRKAANERGARFTEAFGEIKVAEVPAKLKEMLDQRHERLRDVFNEWALALAGAATHLLTKGGGTLQRKLTLASYLRRGHDLPFLRIPLPQFTDASF